MAVTRLYTPRPYDSFDPGIAGVAPIVATGTDVDNTKLTAVQAAAAAAGLGTLPTSAGGTAPTPTSAVLRFRGPWQANTAYQYGDVIQIVDGSGNTLAYSANLNFTSGSTFNATNWTELTYPGGSAASLPSQTGNNSKVLTTDGSNPSWNYPVGGVNGLAQLGSDGLVPASQLPATTAGVLGYISVKAAPYNAKGDGRTVWDGSVTNGSATVTSATATFVAGDIGKTIIVGGTFTTTIAAVASSTSATMAATYTGSTGGGYGLTIGTDDTAAIQAAMTAAANAGGATVFLPRGVYVVAGAQVSGNVTGTGASAGQTFTYSGQLLFPAVSNAAAMIPIRLLGETPVAGASIQPILAGAPPTGGSLIVSNATTGNVFDTIPTPASPSNIFNIRTSNVHAMFEGVGIRAPLGQPITALNLSCPMGATVRQVRVDVASAAQLNTGMTHASSVAVRAPGLGNYGIVHFNDTEVMGYGTGFILSEHTVMEGCYIQVAKTGLVMGKADHLNTVANLCIQHCDTYIAPIDTSSSSYMYGSMTVELGANAVFLADPNGLIRGELAINMGGLAQPGGLPNNGGYGMNLRVIARSAALYPTTTMQGWMGEPVQEDFTRQQASTTALQSTGISQHPWSNGEGVNVIGVSGGKGAPVSGYGTRYVNAPPTQRGYVRSRITLSATNSSIGITPRAGQGGSKYYFGAFIQVSSTVNRIGFVKVLNSVYTTISTLESAGFAQGGTYELSVLWDQPIKNGPCTVTAYVDGVSKLAYTLTSAEQIAFGYPVYCGLLLSPNGTPAEDFTSRWLDFYAVPA